MNARTLFDVTAEAVARRIAMQVDGSESTFKLYRTEVRDAMIARMIKRELDQLDARFQEILTEVIT